MKQVQRNDEDPTLFDVIYLDTHTCVRNEVWGEATQVPARDMRIPLDLWSAKELLLLENKSGATGS